MSEPNIPLDVKAYLAAADSVVDALPWRLGDTEAQRRRARGRVASLAHQVAGLIAGGGELDEIRTVLAGAAGAAAAQEKRWRSAFKQARHARRQAERPPWQPAES